MVDAQRFPSFYRHQGGLVEGGGRRASQNA